MIQAYVIFYYYKVCLRVLPEVSSMVVNIGKVEYLPTQNPNSINSINTLTHDRLVLSYHRQVLPKAFLFHFSGVKRFCNILLYLSNILY